MTRWANVKARDWLINQVLAQAHAHDTNPNRKFFLRGSPMGQPDTVNQMPDRAQLVSPKFDDTEKVLVKPLKPFLWDILPTN